MNAGAFRVTLVKRTNPRPGTQRLRFAASAASLFQFRYEPGARGWGAPEAVDWVDRSIVLAWPKSYITKQARGRDAPSKPQDAKSFRWH
jgi:hypothetical protein